MFIGIDDTDSERGLCTTYLAAVLMERLAPWGEICGLPRLIRLNPCVRYKTRGNAALTFSLDSEQPDMVKRVALQTLLELSDLSGANTNPGLVIAEEVTERMKAFYCSAVREILSIDAARSLLDEEGIWYRGFKKGRGLIGALAAVGAELPDWTYELIAYRQPSRWGTPRFIDHSTVWEADRLTYPLTWDTVDHHNGRVVFAPHSADPVLFGIRGSDPTAIKRAFEAIRSEPVDRYVLYQTNQGTDAHILPGEIGRISENQSYRLHGFVAGPARVIPGGHLFFTLEKGGGGLSEEGLEGESPDGKWHNEKGPNGEELNEKWLDGERRNEERHNGERLDGGGVKRGRRIECAAFEPTKNFRDIIKKLRRGDELEVYGSVRDGTMNLEKINILHLAPDRVKAAPLCPQCHRRMKSAGKDQGYRCRLCKSRSSSPAIEDRPRDLERGYYEVPPCARRHLSLPLIRLNRTDICLHPSR
ncbi:MAG: tRNA(Ile)(2)-agmatinylcytidine synthase [Methanothrix sp.]|uniref:tRNA(Ile)(2)-agmatinylcytidine synthase n=1 Tax=Methanothrix sp. TaxID=90426 RepID=UPI0025F861A6|nr:tRNA(Ile)(2)-agmatinylcytidine synthase [Methanothrix sp.]